MSHQIYNWKRFWCLRTGNVNLSDGGYLFDPDSAYGKSYNADVVSFESIAEIPCLILLGEPGIGKTHAMKAEQDDIRYKIEKKGDQIIFVDLRSLGSEDRLVRSLFESAAFVSWAKGRNRLHLFLDSLDECLLRIDTVAALLVDELKKHPAERLYLRVACRTADWPAGLEANLAELWGNHAVGVYELVPLRRVDVIEAARNNELDPNVFLSEVERTEVVPLAIKPITLNFLINTYRRSGRFPSTQAELYLQGCELLCEETSESRRDARRLGIYSAKQRMIMAARVAALIILANRYAIWTGIDQGDVTDEDAKIQELSGGSKRLNGDEFQVSEAAIRETLATGLFSSRGPNRLGFAHQTYAEFLASHYLIQRQMPLPQIMSLLIHPGDPDKKLVPQLYETAAWLAGMVPGVFRDITSVNPEVLLKSDIATADVKDRAALVKSLLKLSEEETLFDYEIEVRKRYRKLAHPGLVDQLREFISDGTKGIVVRRVAIDIAEACELRGLQDDLVRISLDEHEPSSIRENAAFAISLTGDGDVKAKLKPLATGEAGDDPVDELKGCGLRSVWPAHMTAEELFKSITPPKRDSLFGVYRSFLLDDLVKHLRPVDLTIALKWLEEQGTRDGLPDPFEELMDDILLKAWEHIEPPGVLENFGRAVISRLRHHDQILKKRSDQSFKSMLENDDCKRRLILEAMIPLLNDPGEAVLLIYTPIVLNKDVLWMIERLRVSEYEKDQRVWAQLIARTFDLNEPGQFEAVYDSSQNIPVLAEALSWLLKPIELNSLEAKKMKADYLKRQELQKRANDRPPLDPPPAERVSHLLDECESGNIAAWWRLNMEMTLEPNSRYYENEHVSDLAALPGWKAADSITKVRIVETAKRYLFAQDPNTKEWLGKNVIHRPAYAGYRALRLLLQEAPDFLSGIPSDVWKKWAPITLAYWITGGKEDEEAQQKLINMAYKHAPEEIIYTLVVLIDKEDKELGEIYIIRKVEGCWDERLANALLTKVKDNKLKPGSIGSLLSNLLDHNVKEAKKFAESCVPLLPPSSVDERSRAIIIASALMVHAEDAGWSVVWPAIRQDIEFGREMISMVAHRYDRLASKFGERLTEEHLADLFIWLVHQYPHSEDPKHEEAYAVSPRDSIAFFRDGILENLKQRGTQKACGAILRIISELPELTWLKWTLAQAQAITRRRTWKPPRIEDIMKIASNQQLRLIQNGDQLLDVLIESLKGLEKKLRAETPASRDIWDRVGNKVFRPIEENEFSDYIKRHLDEDLKQRGVIVNRAVRIHRGERTDIHVDAFMLDPHEKLYDTITVIIEVKGCWNPDLDVAMENQLVNRYLKDNRCQRGLYLVGWFNCYQWDDKDYRKKQTVKLSKGQAQENFDGQATSLSRQGVRVKALVMDTSLH
jgi:predicted NACHT family NTPase